MPRRARPLIVLLLLMIGSAAHAQDTVQLQFVGEGVGPIGIDNCEDLANSQFTIEVAAFYDDVDTDRVGEVRLYYHTGTQCDRSNGLETCDARLVNGDGSICGCMDEEGNSSTGFNVTTSLDEMGLTADVCADGAPDSITFTAELYFPATADVSAETIPPDDSSALPAISIDRVRPTAPTGAPSAQSSENALVISVAAVDNAEQYEVCVLPETEGNDADVLSGTNQELQAGFSCRSASALPEQSYRFDGLNNDVNYLVTYAVYDAAGNRSPNSPRSTGRPSEQLDFAEVYAEYADSGERGGCRAAVGAGDLPHPGATGLLGLGLMLAIRRRRP